jgi:WD40 repeat protein
MTKDGHLASGLGNGKIKIWNISNGIVVNTLEAHTEKINALALLSSGDLASGSDDNTVKIWFSSTNSVKSSLDARDNVNCLKELKNGELASGQNDFTIKIWDVNAPMLKDTLYGHLNKVNDLELLPNGDLASCSDDFSIKIWDTNSFTLKHNLYGHNTAVNKLKLLSNGHLASGSSGRSVAGENIQNSFELIDTSSLGLSNTLVIDNFLSELNGNLIKIWDVSIQSILRNMTNVADVLSLVTSDEFSTKKSTSQNMDLTTLRSEIDSTSDILSSSLSSIDTTGFSSAETTAINNPSKESTVASTITSQVGPGFNFEQISSAQAVDLLKSSYDLSGCLANCSNKGLY